MNHPFFAFLKGLLLSAVALLVVFFIWMYATFSFGGGETLDAVRHKAFLLLLAMALVAGVAGFLTRKDLKAGEKAKALGKGLLPILALLLACWHYARFLDRHVDFDQAAWNRSRVKPFAMSVSLTKGKQLVGMSEAQVKELLGASLEKNPEQRERDGISYFVETGWILTIYFEQDRVTETGLRTVRLFD